MNEQVWAQLIQNTVFLSPGIVERFAADYGDPAVMPVTFRGQPSDWSVPHNNGYPVRHDGKWYSLWGQRPAREACSLALGLRRQDLEKGSLRPVTCTNDTRVEVERNWRVHHIYECGLSGLSLVDKAARFTNLANLVLVKKEYHEAQRSFIHGAGLGAVWLKWAIGVLYPLAIRSLGIQVAQPDGSPSIAQINIAIANSEGYAGLKNLREQKPAGSDIATRRWKEMIDKKWIPETPIVSAPQAKMTTKPVAVVTSPEGLRSPNEITNELKRRGYIARQNSQPVPVPLYLNLGGIKSELNRIDFRGVVLFYPKKHIIFGVAPAEVTEFRELVMERTGQTKWIRREGVLGLPNEFNRVTVEVVVPEVGEPRMICRVHGEEIRFDGYAETLRFQNDKCDWRDVEAFLKNLDRFCLQMI